MFEKITSNHKSTIEDSRNKEHFFVISIGVNTIQT